MDNKQLKKICNKCIEYIQTGKADHNQWLATKKDILNKWAAGYILSTGQIEVVVKMYNNEVHDQPVADIFAATATKKPNKPKPVETTWEDDGDIPF